MLEDIGIDNEINREITFSQTRLDGSCGILLLLGIPKHSNVTLDGASRIVTREDGYVGILGLDPNLFHLFACRPCVSSVASDAHRRHSLAVGVVMMIEGRTPSEKNNDKYGWIVARKYDERTEELSSSDIFPTFETLAGAVHSGNIPEQIFCRYQEFVADSSPTTIQDANISVERSNKINDSWLQHVSYIGPTLLSRRGIHHGDKIVPGTFRIDGEASGLTNAHDVSTDGSVIKYPPIPCIESVEGATNKVKHEGTKYYLKSLTPKDRTLLLHYYQPPSTVTKITYSSVGSAVLEEILQSYYEGNWEDLIGDLQLSFVSFMYISCLASFEHWRDLITMLSLAGEEQVINHTCLFSALFCVLTCQVKSIERDFFEEVDYSSGNFFLPSVQRLVVACSCQLLEREERIRQPLQKFLEVMTERFGVSLNTNRNSAVKHAFSENGANYENDSNSSESDNDERVSCPNEKLSVAKAQDKKALSDTNGVPTNDYAGTIRLLDDSSEDEDGPVIVSCEEIEESLCRSSVTRPNYFSLRDDLRDRQLEHRYPLLFSAMIPNLQEDIVMTCARILESASDVSLVREAASYLEDIENSKK